MIQDEFSNGKNETMNQFSVENLPDVHVELSVGRPSSFEVSCIQPPVLLHSKLASNSWPQGMQLLAAIDKLLAGVPPPERS